MKTTENKKCKQLVNNFKQSKTNKKNKQII